MNIKLSKRLKIMETALIKRMFYLLYNSFAWIYDVIAAIVSLGQWYHWIEHIIPFLKGPTILELGFGTGHLQSQLLKRHYKCFGLDQSLQMAKIAYKNIQKESHESIISASLFSSPIFQANAQAIPFDSETFINIVATFPTEYIVQAETLKEVYRVLAPDGVLILLPAAWITGKNIPAKLIALLYQLTQQSLPENLAEIWSASFNSFGFIVQEHWLQQAGSKLLILTASKKGNSINSKN